MNQTETILRNQYLTLFVLYSMHLMAAPGPNATRDLIARQLKVMDSTHPGLFTDLIRPDLILSSGA